jgi:hypothetical protein
MIMNDNVEKINQILLKILKEVNPDIISKLSVHEKQKLARDENIPPETLNILVNDEDLGVRYLVAQNPNTPPETLTLLVEDKSWAVRYTVAGNPNTPLETLIILANDESEAVREVVSGNTNYKNLSYLTSQQRNAIKKLIEACQDEILKTIKL